LLDLNDVMMGVAVKCFDQIFGPMLPKSKGATESLGPKASLGVAYQNQQVDQGGR
jgi:hypothetical protein